jgi:hypothetical protein
MTDTLTYPADPTQFETGSETLDSIIAVLEVMSDFIDFYFGFL